MKESLNQEKIWEYFQGEGISNFDDAIPRLDHLFHFARRQAKGQKPTVLNIGVGNGWLERRCRDEGWKISSLDPDRNAVQALKAEGINANVGVIEDMPLPDDHFDIVFCSEVLEHLQDRQLAGGLKQISRVLKSGGKLIGTVPYNETLSDSLVVCPDCNKRFHRWGHHQSFDKQTIASVLGGAGFKVVSVSTYAFPVYGKNMSLERVFQSLRWILGRLFPDQVYSNLVFLAEEPSQ